MTTFSHHPYWRLSFLLISILFSSTSMAPTLAPTEDELKAALLYNFALFTEWPTPPQATFNLCLYGGDPFGKALQVLTQRTLLDRPVQVRHLRQPTEINDCHLLYISPAASPELEQVLNITRYRPILTIADQPLIEPAQSVISLKLEQQKVVFDVNQAAAQQAGLRLSSKMLRLARRVVQP